MTQPHHSPPHRSDAPGHGDHGHGDHGHGHGDHGHGARVTHDSHGHSHAGHGHGIAPLAGNLGTSFAIATALNVAFVAVEATYGVLTGSTALLADAAHNLSDVLGLVLAWGAARMAKRAASARYTYGFRRTTVLAALSNAVLLFVAVGAVAGEAIGKFWQPAAVPGKTVLFVALFGVLINGASAALFTKHAHDDANVRGAFLHLLTDALVSVGVVVVGALLLWQPSWVWLDPLVSLLISVVILIGTWRLLRDSLHLSLDGVPPRLDRDEVAQYLAQLPGVLSVHDLHIWAISTSESALTTHLVVSDQAPRGLAARASDELAARFGIDHVTVQLDTPEQASNCRTC